MDHASDEKYILLLLLLSCLHSSAVVCSWVYAGVTAVKILCIFAYSTRLLSHTVQVVP